MNIFLKKIRLYIKHNQFLYLTLGIPRYIVFAIAHFPNALSNIMYSIAYFRSFTFCFVNHITVGCKYLSDQQVIMPHPIGIVIGKNVCLGKNITIYQNVTLGTKDGLLYPILHDGVTVYAGAVVVGGIKIGKNAIIGANSFVNIDVPDNAIVVGCPARILYKN